MAQLVLNLPDSLIERIEAEAQSLGTSSEARIIEILEGAIAPAANINPESLAKGLEKLRRFLEKVPAITDLSTRKESDAYWWVKFRIDIKHPLAWNVVQELGHILNYISLEERLPTVFRPVSPPPYINGGPDQFLSWVIEATLPFVDAGQISDFLEESLPEPVEDEDAWTDVEEDN